MKILYIINFAGTPPLNFLESFLKSKNNELCIIKLPSVRPMKNSILYDPYLQFTDNHNSKYNFVWNISLPIFIVFGLQYILNLFFAIKFFFKLRKVKFDIVIGETNFGACVAKLSQWLGLASYSVYMNGDVLPDIKSKGVYFTGGSVTRFFEKIFIFLQLALRRIAFKCNLIWYPNNIVSDWDKQLGFNARDEIIFPTVLVNIKEVNESINVNKDPYTFGYIGRLDHSAGLDFGLNVFAKITNKYPSAKLLVVGGGSLVVDHYLQVARKLNIDKNVEFFGYVPDRETARNILAKATFGFAFYSPAKDNVSLYAEPGKPKDYINLGMLPLSIKGGPVVCEEISKSGAGFQFDNDVNSAAVALLEILATPNLYDLRKSSIVSFAKTYDKDRLLEEFYSKLQLKFNQYKTGIK